MSRIQFGKLQNAIARGTDFDEKDLKQALLFDPESPESLSTFTRGLIKAKINPSKLFVTAALLAIQVNKVFVSYAGLALRFGANPNTYIASDFMFDDQKYTVPVHIAKHIWDITPRSAEESVEFDRETFGDYEPVATETQSEADIVEGRFEEKKMASLDLLCLMTVMGFVPDAQVTTVDLLVKAGINATKFAAEHQDFFSSVFTLIRLDGELGDAFAVEIKYFEQWKNGLQNVYGIVPERDPRILRYAYILDLTPVLSLTTIYSNIDNYRDMFYYQDTDSLTAIIPRLKELGFIGTDPSTTLQSHEQIDENREEMKRIELMLVEYCLSYYNLDVMKVLLNLGITPDYVIRSQTVRDSKAACNNYPIQCQLLNTMLVEYAKKGYGLDKVQMQELYTFSKSTYEAIRDQYKTPVWKTMCMVKTGDVNPDMKEIAREIGIPVGSDKQQICDTFESMYASSPDKLKAASYEVNRNRIGLSTISAVDIISGKRVLSETRTLPALGSDSIDQIQQTANKGNLGPKSKLPSASSSPVSTTDKNVIKPRGTPTIAPVCSNANTLDRPIEDYPAIDRVTYNDGKQTWCFTSDNFEQLLETGINPFATNAQGGLGDAIPSEVLLEMQQKLSIIKENKLPETPGSVSKGIDKLFDSNPADTEDAYERESKRQLERFYEFAEEYGIERDRFYGLTSPDYQILADSILSSATRVVINPTSPILALRDFSNAIMIEIANFKNADDVGRTLASMLS